MEKNSQNSSSVNTSVNTNREMIVKKKLVFVRKSTSSLPSPTPIHTGFNKPNVYHGHISQTHSVASTSPKTSTYHTNASNSGNGSRKPFNKSRPLQKRMGTKKIAEQINKKVAEYFIPQVGENIRIIPLGGVEEIGKNITILEYKNDIIVMDIGFQFRDENTPGIDYILPNTKYIEDRKEKVRAVIITHGHLDHIGGIPYVMERIGNPPLFTRELTSLMIKKRQEEFPHSAPLNLKVIEKDSCIKLGELSVEFFSVNHTIPDSMGIKIRTPYGNVVNLGDMRIDNVAGVPTKEEEKYYTEKFSNHDTLLLLADSTSSDNPGWNASEDEVCKNIDDIIKNNTRGRLIIGTFASQIERMISMVESAEKYGKKIVVEGRSMKNNIEIVRMAGRLKVGKDTVIMVEDMQNYPPNRIVILATGAQGDEFAALMRMGSGSHKNVKINKTDTVLLSSSIVPGNEKAVQKLKDNLARQGAKIITYRTSEVYIHASGHAKRGELTWVYNKIKPKFFIPIHGSHFMLRANEELSIECGMKSENVIVPDNGTIIEIQNDGQKMVALREKAPASLVMVDGFSIGDVQEVVIRDRQMLAQDGMFVIIANIDIRSGILKKSPDIISRGFVYLRESQELLKQTRHIIKKTIEENIVGMNPVNFDYLKDIVTDNVSRYLFQQTAKRPMVIPVIIGV
ncbi:MAG: ribonuclease J [Minisyncoccia bacterium]